MKTGRGYFVKGNREPPWQKRAYALGIRKEDFPKYGLPVVEYAPKTKTTSLQELQVQASVEGVPQYAQSASFAPSIPAEPLTTAPAPPMAVEKPWMRPVAPVSQAPVDDALMATPKYDVNTLENAEQSALAEYDKQKLFEASIGAGGDVVRIPPNELHVTPTPSVPPQPRSIIEEDQGGLVQP
jgi:hypothetical protein